MNDDSDDDDSDDDYSDDDCSDDAVDVMMMEMTKAIKGRSKFSTDEAMIQTEAAMPVKRVKKHPQN